MDNRKNLTVEEVVNCILNELEEKLYSPHYLRDIKNAFNNIIAYTHELGEISYSEIIGKKFLYEKYRFTRGDGSKRISQIQRAVNILDEYLRRDYIVPRVTHKLEFPVFFDSFADAYLNKLNGEFKSKRTIRINKAALLKFANYLENKEITDISELNIDIVNSYFVNSLAGYGRQYIRDNINMIKRFIVFLYSKGVLPEDFTSKLVKVKLPSVPQHLPDAFTEEEISKILSSVDRESPVGKRDYAILLIAIRLGLRTSDIRTLTPKNIDWKNHKLNIIQAKTKCPLNLPLPDDVGWAVIDYMKNARPICNAEEIFVRISAPYVPMNNYDYILCKYMRMAGVKAEKLRHHGFHALRSSLATRMLKNGVSIEKIQETLGHANIETTSAYYAGVDINQLTECSLEVPEL